MATIENNNRRLLCEGAGCENGLFETPFRDRTDVRDVTNSTQRFVSYMDDNKKFIDNEISRYKNRIGDILQAYKEQISREDLVNSDISAIALRHSVNLSLMKDIQTIMSVVEEWRSKMNSLFSKILTINHDYNLKLTLIERAHEDARNRFRRRRGQIPTTEDISFLKGNIALIKKKKTIQNIEGRLVRLGLEITKEMDNLAGGVIVLDGTTYLLRDLLRDVEKLVGGGIFEFYLSPLRDVQNSLLTAMKERLERDVGPFSSSNDEFNFRPNPILADLLYRAPREMRMDSEEISSPSTRPSVPMETEMQERQRPTSQPPPPHSESLPTGGDVRFDSSFRVTSRLKEMIRTLLYTENTRTSIENDITNMISTFTPDTAATLFQQLINDMRGNTPERVLNEIGLRARSREEIFSNLGRIDAIINNMTALDRKAYIKEFETLKLDLQEQAIILIQNEESNYNDDDGAASNY
jgi:hypothetical protein